MTSIDNEIKISDEDYFNYFLEQKQNKLKTQLLDCLGSKFKECQAELETCGITKISGLFSLETITNMQNDVLRWSTQKTWNVDKEMYFDGATGENYLSTSKAMSEAVSNKAILALVTSCFQHHVRLNWVRTYCLDKVENYERRAFQWHHDGWSEHFIKVMILLSDVEDDGQRMIFSPGLQNLQYNTKESFETQLSNSFVQKLSSINCSGKAGDVYIFFPHCPHTGRRNLSKRRDVVVMGFAPGLGRNYGIPSLHPDIVSQLDPYERIVYREDKSFENAYLAFKTLNEQFSSLAGEYFTFWVNKNAQSIAKMLQNFESDKNLFELSVKNKQKVCSNIATVSYRHDDFINNEDSIKEILIESSKIKSIFENIEQSDLEAFRKNYQIVIQRDLHRDLNLPVRMYHPFKDSLRDFCIVRIRDRSKNEHSLGQIFDELSATSLENFRTLHFSGDIIKNLNNFVRNIKTHRDILQKTKGYMDYDSYYQFLNDLEDMLIKAITLEAFRSILIYLDLTLRYLINLPVEDKKINEEVLLMEREVLMVYKYLLVIETNQYYPKICVIGAGPIGLGMGSQFNSNLYKNYYIFEKESNVGGMCKSFRDVKGFSWDIGPHILFSRFKEIENLILKDADLEGRVRKAIVIIDKDNVVNYPFQLNVHELEEKLRSTVKMNIEDMIARKNPRNEINGLDSFNIETNGNAICDIFLTPYNKKIWGKENYVNMHYKWLESVSATIDFQKVLQNIKLVESKIAVDHEVWGPNKLFYYPRNKNLGAFWSDFADAHVPKDKIYLNHELTRIDVHNKTITFSNGKYLNYDVLYTTIPLPNLVNILDTPCKDILAKLAALVNSLVYTSIYVVGIGFKGKLTEKFKNVHWAYIPNEKICFYRLSFPKNFSSANVPQGEEFNSVLVEINKEWLKDNEYGSTDLVNLVLNHSLAVDLFTKDVEIVSQFIYDLKFAYPVPTINRDQILQEIQEILDKFCIKTEGRFGKWKYEESNMDCCLRIGRSIASQHCF